MARGKLSHAESCQSSIGAHCARVVTAQAVLRGADGARGKLGGVRMKAEMARQRSGNAARRLQRRRSVGPRRNLACAATATRRNGRRQQRRHDAQRGALAHGAPPLSSGSDGASLAVSGRSSGSVTENVEPCPSVLSTSTYPPCNSVSFCTMLSPRRRARSRVLVRPNLGEYLRTVAAGPDWRSPGPCPETLSRSRILGARRLQRDLARAVYLSALVPRFSTIWRSRWHRPRAAAVVVSLDRDVHGPYRAFGPRAATPLSESNSRTSTCSGCSFMRPTRARDSSTLLNSASKCSPDARNLCAGLRAGHRSAGPRSRPRALSVKPKIAFSGVRSSWLTVVRNSLLYRSASWLGGARRARGTAVRGSPGEALRRHGQRADLVQGRSAIGFPGRRLEQLTHAAGHEGEVARQRAHAEPCGERGEC